MTEPSLWLSMDRLGFHLVQGFVSLLWQSSILLGMAATGAWLLRRRSAAIQQALWVSAVLATPFLPLLAWWVTSVDAPQATIEVLPVYSGPVPISEPPEPLTNDASPLPVDPANLPAEVDPAKSPRHFGPLSYPWALGLLTYVLGATSLVALVLVGRLRIGRWIREGKLLTDPAVLERFRTAGKMLGLKKSFSLVESREAVSPMTFGILRPVVLLPEGLAARLSHVELDALSLHELNHVRRRDPLTLTVLSFLRATLFFHPIIWIACRRIAVLTERACDEAVTETTRRPVSYAKMLARFAEELPGRALSAEMVSGVALSKRTLLRRIEAILSSRSRRIRRLSRLAIATTAVVSVGTLGLALAFPLGEPAENDGEPPETPLVDDVGPSEEAPSSGITLKDLQEGKVDVDGDGTYTVGDDKVLSWFRENNPDKLQEALKLAKRRSDGGIDLSPYFLSGKFQVGRAHEERLQQQFQSDELAALVITRWEDRENREAGALGAKGQLHKKVDYGIKLHAMITASGKPVEGASFHARMAPRDQPSDGVWSFRSPHGGSSSRANGLADASIAGTKTFERGLEEYRFELGAYHPRLGFAHEEYTYDQLAARTAGELVLELERGLVLQGRVLAKDGDPVPGAQVLLHTVTAPGGLQMRDLTVSTGADGTFTMAGIRFQNIPQSLEVTFRGEWPAAAGTSPTSQRDRRRAEAEAPRVRAQVPIRTSVGREEGTLNVPDIFLSLGPTAPWKPGPQGIDRQAVDRTSAGGRDDMPLRDIRPPTGEPRNVTFSLQVTARIVAAGRPVASAGFGVTLATISSPFRSFDYRQLSARSGGDGIAKTEMHISTLYAGEPDEAPIGIAAYHPELGSAYKELSYGELKTMGAEDLVLELEKRLVIQGRVVDKSNTPIPGARIVLATSWRMGSPSMHGTSVTTNDDGRFTLAGVGFLNTPQSLTVSYGDDRTESRFLPLPPTAARGIRRQGAAGVTATLDIRRETSVADGVVTLPDIKLSLDIKA